MATHFTLLGKNINEKTIFLKITYSVRSLRRMSPFIKEHKTQIEQTNFNQALMKKTNLIFSNYIFSEASEKDELASCYFL